MIKVYKIKNDIDLDFLLNYQYKYSRNNISQECYIKKLYHDDEIYITDNRIINFCIEDFCGDDFNEYCETLINDLIKSNKVEEI